MELSGLCSSTCNHTSTENYNYEAYGGTKSSGNVEEGTKQARSEWLDSYAICGRHGIDLYRLEHYHLRRAQKGHQEA